MKADKCQGNIHYSHVLHINAPRPSEGNGVLLEIVAVASRSFVLANYRIRRKMEEVLPNILIVNPFN